MPRLGKRCQGFALRRGLLAALLCGILRCAWAQELEEARKLFLTGKYGECLAACAKPEAEGESECGVATAPRPGPADGWALSAGGGRGQQRPVAIRQQHPAAHAGGGNGQRHRQPRLWPGPGCGKSTSSRARDPGPTAIRPDIVALGQAALLLGADPKLVLERLFGPAQKADPESARGSSWPTANWRWTKTILPSPPRLSPRRSRNSRTMPDLLYGLARAYQPSARGQDAGTDRDRAGEKREPCPQPVVAHRSSGGRGRIHRRPTRCWRGRSRSIPGIRRRGRIGRCWRICAMTRRAKPSRARKRA